MKDTMRSTPPILARSIRKSLTTTTPISTAPQNQSTRNPRRVATTIDTSARIVQKMDRATCTRSDRNMVSSW